MTTRRGSLAYGRRFIPRSYGDFGQATTRYDPHDLRGLDHHSQRLSHGMDDHTQRIDEQDFDYEDRLPTRHSSLVHRPAQRHTTFAAPAESRRTADTHRLQHHTSKEIKYDLARVEEALATMTLRQYF